jgi:phenylacetate-CoA ligase
MTAIRLSRGEPLETDRFDNFLGSWNREVPTEADQISAWQLAKAWTLAVRLADSNPFYRGRLRLPAGRDADAFRSLSSTTKNEVVSDCMENPPFGSRSTVWRGDVRMVVQTSGTSGRGVEVYPLDESDEAAIVRTEAVGFIWAGVRPGSRVFLTLPIGITAAGLWYHATLRALGAFVLPVGPYSTERKVDVLSRFGADLVIGTPSYVHRLARGAMDAGLDLPSLGVRAVLVAGESFSPGWAAAMEKTWGTTLYEQYGCTERAIAWTCPGGVRRGNELGVLHFPPESGYHEVIEPLTGLPVSHGGEGELVVTPFGADASPLVRYATGDRVRWMAPGSCSCGRPLAGIAAGEVQRFDDMLKIRGVNVWPAHFDAAVFAVEGVTDYRGVVGTDALGGEVLEIRLETSVDSGVTAEDVAAAVRRATGLTATVRMEATGTLAKEVPEGFAKIKRWTDRREVR